MRKSHNHIISLILILFSLSLTAQAIPDEILEVTFISSQNAVVPGDVVDVALVLDIVQPWHVYAPEGNDDYIIPVSPTIEVAGSVISVADWRYPEAEMISVAGVKEPAAVYGGQLILRSQLTIAADAADSVKIAGSVFYQACDDSQCLIPETITFSHHLPVMTDPSLITAANSSIFGSSTNTEADISEMPAEDDDITGLVDRYGIFLTFAIIFLGGLALNLTPCVYPLIPITISFFGGKETSRGHTFWMALAYVLGIAVTYSILGVVAALGGGLFGALLTNPWVLIGIAAILIGLSLSMFGVYEFRLPTGLMTAASQSKAGVFGSFFMGLTLGIVAAPCVGPFIIGLLTYVAAQQSVVLGFSMFFTLAMGLGLPYLFLAMYSSKISALPRSGTWMVGVRVIFGFVLIAMAIYFLMPLLGDYGSIVMSVFLIGAGIYLIMFDRSGDGNLMFKRIQQVVAILLIMIGTWTAVPEPEHQVGGISWEYPGSVDELNTLLQGEKPIMIDVFADWCIPCKEMDKFTFSDPDVIELSQQFTNIKIDLTHQGGEYEMALMEKFLIRGVPSYIFIQNGEELTQLRSTGFENAEDYLTRMKKAL
ncbi:MAG: thioredoxin family protein [Candidatus Marinimicrobia bacterium]|nr:thioredoxin family protein [Candidatus Neomarinimicrobiota bacterium]MCF7850471.1 thioredoxin family protein [Candidatus Neomarinimicrobiota bacterium]MCF7905053.1 thioredoxin family protein [Candidatus Neomarinimicrobiota bacterium]